MHRSERYSQGVKGVKKNEFDEIITDLRRMAVHQDDVHLVDVIEKVKGLKEKYEGVEKEIGDVS